MSEKMVMDGIIALQLAKQGGGSGTDANAVHYTADSNKTDAQKAQARDNIGVTQLLADKADKLIIKATMDAVATVNTGYYLGELATLSITMPTDALVSQQIVVIFSSGATACTLVCDLAGFSFTPKANKTNKLVFTLIHNADVSVVGDVDKWTVETEES